MLSDRKNKTCWSILTNFLSSCPPVTLFLVVSAGYLYSQHRASSSDLVSLPPEIPTLDNPFGTSSGDSRASRRMHSLFDKVKNKPKTESIPLNANSPKCLLFVDGQETGLIRYGTSRTTISCFFRDGDGECGIRYSHGNSVYHHYTSSMDTFYLQDDEEMPHGTHIHVSCELKPG